MSGELRVREFWQQRGGKTLLSGDHLVVQGYIQQYSLVFRWKVLNHLTF